jgi:CheY-like chemotaxis protein
MMGGTIWVESEPGVGSAFFFTAWFGVGSEIDHRRFVPDLAGIRVLVVDDNAQAREILSDTLRGFALRADAVRSGEEAIRALADADAIDPYQLVLMDWQMPEMDGLQASAIIRREGRLKNVPRIVIVTGFGREEVRSMAEQIGVDGFLTKPVNASMLYDTLMELFGASHLANEDVESRKVDSAGYDVRGLRVLLVEDNEINQQVATELLESAGAVVTIAGNGAIAVKLLRERGLPQRFDVVLMDLQMPEMDGYEAARLLRADPRFQELPILAMTAHALVEERERCIAAGMNDHVTKPIDPDALFAALMRWTKHRAQASPPVSQTDVPSEMIFPEVVGIDTAAGLKRVAGNRQLYRSLLDQFVDKQADVSARIADALERNDRALAQRLAHTVKGVAGNIGMIHTQEAAGKLEKALRDNDPAIQTILSEFESAVASQIGAIRRALSETIPHVGSASKFDPSKAAAAIARLDTLLAANDGDAGEAVQVVFQLLAGQADAQMIAALRASIDDFDFDTARSILGQIAAASQLK